METKAKNREWVKNAAIIFLAVLLVLTFFSNTIMNRSLPEVATAYVQSNSINAKVRGSGTVESQGVYEVKAAETREIRAVMIKSGQKVEPGDVLFVLGEGDSSEIEAAQEQLRQLKLNYQQTLAGATNYSGKLASAQTRYENAAAAEAAAFAELNGNVDFQNSLTALNAAKEKLASAELNYRLANETALQSLDNLISRYVDFIMVCTNNGAGADSMLKLSDAQYSLNSAREAVAATDGSVNSVAVAYDRVQAAKNKLTEFSLSADGSALLSIGEVALPFNELDLFFDSVEEYLSDGSDNLIDAVNAQLEAMERCNSAQTQYDAFSSMFSETYNAAVAERQAAEAALKALRENAEDYNKQAALTGLSLQDLQYQIDKAQAKLDELSGGSDNRITANVSGTVSSVAVTAGKTASKDEVLATIEVPDLGYTLSFSVTTDQARRLHLGDPATVSSYYWGSKIDATLTAIKPDPKNPQTNKLLEFEVTGDVSAGSQLTLSIGERSQNYDLVVPNSAIRTDSNGKFVYVIQAKNSALGNRYFARRANVEVIASDDNNSAVTGALNYGDYVITTASAPIKSGDQVRLNEG
ncbi:MAG: HlyD family efflux transporter periplasmic adaptor subunit [Oscillospiraceae bacterium]|nr:HlyD family efflux transporter periplasmic adaptor subunit [Oscillospiraceae bacterium]